MFVSLGNLIKHVSSEGIFCLTVTKLINSNYAVCSTGIDNNISQDGKRQVAGPSSLSIEPN